MLRLFDISYDRWCTFNVHVRYDNFLLFGPRGETSLMVISLRCAHRASLTMHITRAGSLILSPHSQINIAVSVDPQYKARY